MNHQMRPVLQAVAAGMKETKQCRKEGLKERMID